VADAHKAGPKVASSSTKDREIGPLGTTARIAAGVLALFILVATNGLSLWNLITGLLVLPAIAIGFLWTLGFSRDRSRAVSPNSGCAYVNERRPWSTEIELLALVTVLVVAVSFVTPITEGSILIWLGTSFLLTSVMGYAGCEMVAIPNLLTGKQHRLPCFLFSSIDRAEARRRKLQNAAQSGGTG
jgi:hypothetical protein